MSLRYPESTSIARARGFNWVVINIFFDLLKCEWVNKQLSAHRILNVDKTSISAVSGYNSDSYNERFKASFENNIYRSWNMHNCYNLNFCWWKLNSAFVHFCSQENKGGIKSWGSQDQCSTTMLIAG